MNFFVRKRCLKHLRQYLNTLVKSTVQKRAHNTANIIFEKRQYLKARLKKLFRNDARNTVVNGFRKKRLIEKFVEKYQLKHCPILRHFFSETDRIGNLLNKYPANVPYKRLGKVRSHEETVLKRSSITFCTEQLSKTPKNPDFEKKQYQKSCQEACRTQKLLTIPLKHRYQEAGAIQEAHQTVTEQRTNHKRRWFFFR